VIQSNTYGPCLERAPAATLIHLGPHRDTPLNPENKTRNSWLILLFRFK